MALLAYGFFFDANTAGRMHVFRSPYYYPFCDVHFSFLIIYFPTSSDGLDHRLCFALDLSLYIQRGERVVFTVYPGGDTTHTHTHAPVSKAHQASKQSRLLFWRRRERTRRTRWWKDESTIAE